MLLVGIMFTVLLIRIFNLQIVKSDYYMENYIQKAEKEVLTSGTRGIIYDRNGVALAYNKLAYSVVIEDNLDSNVDKNETLNTIINKTIKIIEENGDSINHNFYITISSSGSYVYDVSSETERLGFLRDLYGKKSVAELDDEENTLSNDSAEEIMEYFCSEDKFDISDKYTPQEKLNIAMVRYNMSLNSYQKYITTEIATNVNDNTVAAIYEYQAELTGVSVKEDTLRVYADSKYFAPIIGYTGKINDSELSEYNSNGADYISSDYVGKLGIEKEMESYLKGKKGKNTIFVDSTGIVLDTISTTEASAGQDVYLTIDSKLQKAAYTILEQKLAGILYSKIVNHEVVVTDTSKTIDIPVKDVYYQMINNNVVDLEHFNAGDATANEQSVYATFSVRQNSALAFVNEYLNNNEAVPMQSLTDENKDYIQYVYDMLVKEGIINKSVVDTDDETYKAWVNETISLRQFLLYSISKNWIDTSKFLEIGEEEKNYSGTDEIFNAVVSHVNENLPEDKGFSKRVYYYIIYNGSISGAQVCMLLYDQGILPQDDGQYAALAAGTVSAYDFIREQIRTLKITPAQVALDPCSGSVVVTDTDTGDVLALVTYPSYDNNKLSGVVDSDYWEKLNDDMSLPLYNRATQTRTAPGSTFKMASAITGLELGLISPSTVIHDQGIFTKITPSPKCWKYPSNHGAINVSQALEVSCNYFFYELGYNLSIDEHGDFNSDLGLSKIKTFADQLGLTSLSGVEIEENEPEFSTDNSVRSAIGQGSHSFTPVQLARYVNTISNSGNNYKLTLLEKVVDSNGNVVKDYTPVLENTCNFAESTWNAVHYGMRLVCTSGTGKNTFADFPIAVAGKSGTAQENLLKSNHSLFVAYAPYENPEISLSVVIPNGESTGYTAEVVRDTIKYYYGLSSDAEIYGATAAIPTSGIQTE